MKKTALALSLACLTAAGNSCAAILATGNFNTGNSAPTLTITQPFSLVANSTNTVTFMVFEDWVASFDGDINLRGAAAGTKLFYQVNASSILSVPLHPLSLYDHFNPAQGDVGITDGLLFFDPIALNIGDTITIFPQTFSFQIGGFFIPTFNPPPASFEGTVFLASNNTARTNHVSVVPEPSALLLGISGALGLMRRRR